MKKFALLLSVIFSVLLMPSAFAIDFTVDRTGASSSDGTGTIGTLPYCINQAVNGGDAGPHTISFNIPATEAGVDGKYVINLNGTISMWTSRTITIDATTQPEYTCEPLVVLRGSGNGQCFNGGNNGTFHIKGFIIQNWTKGFEFNSSQGSVKNCWVGLNNTGTAAYVSPIKEQGILLNNSAFTIGGPGCDRNVISNTLNYTSDPGPEVGAIQFSGLGASGASALVENNYIGTDKTGAVNIGNGGAFPLREVGILVNNTQSLTIKDNVIGGTAGNGIWALNANNTVITGNIIGLDATGMTAIPNGGAGIRADASSGIIIGGPTASERNIISANGGATDSRNCGAMQWDPNLTDGNGVTCGQGPCEGNCPDKYDATLQCGIYFKSVSGSFIRGNYIGTDSTGNSTGTDNSLGNLYAGIKFEDGSSGNTIGGPDASYRNVIGGNGFDDEPGRVALGYQYKGHGIQLNKATVINSTITNNYIGVGADGTTPIGNRQDGVSLLGSKGNTIANNVISDNAFGIFFQSDFQNGLNSGQPTNNTITGNLIGTDASGTVALGNGVRNYSYVVDDDGGGIGMQHGTNNNLIGGSTEADRNIISGNRYGIIIRYSPGNSNSAPFNNTISGNYIGVDVSGDAALPNEFDGILVSESASDNIIGGTSAGEGNIIAGNTSNGINIVNGDENSIFNNSIGISASGNQLGNGGDGIRISSDAGLDQDSGSVSNIIGGPLAGQGNAIAYNAGNGINIVDAESNLNSISRNSIFCNTLRGIELNGVGNENFAAPEIQDRSTATTIYGTAPANSYVELFETGDCNPTCTFGTNLLQGKTYIGFAIADENGDWTFTGTGLDYSTLTATASEITSEPTSAVAYNTSEFSTCIDFCTPPGSVTITASGETTICESETIPTLTAVATADGEVPYTYTWYSISGSDSTEVGTGEDFTPTEAGTYAVEVFALSGICSTISDDTTISINENPEINISSSASAICIGDSAELSVLVTPESGDYDFGWTSSTGTAPSNVASAFVKPETTTKYYLTVTNTATGCTSESDSVEVIVNPLPDASITVSGATEFCHDGNEVVLRAVKDADFTYQWNNGSENIAAPEGIEDSLVVNTSGNYSVTVTNTLTGCIDSSATPTEVVVHANPVVTLSPSANPICKGETATLVVDVTEGTAPYTYDWTADSPPAPTGANPDVSPEDTTNYTVSVTDLNGCPSNVASAAINVNPLPDTTTTFSGDLVFCEGDSVTLEAVEGYAAYQWKKDEQIISGATSSSYVAKESGNYTVEITTTESCVLAGGSRNVTVNPNPALTLDPDEDANTCIGSELPITATGVGSFEWFVDDVKDVDSVGNTYTATETAEYKVILTTDATGCFTQDSVTITFSTDKIAFLDAEANEFCEGDSVLISADPSDGTLYKWFFNNALLTESGNTLYASEPGDYKVYIETPLGCKDTSDAVTINMNLNPSAEAFASGSEICMDDSVSVSVVPSGGTAPYTYSWSGGNTDSVFYHSPTATTTYSVVVADAKGCQSAEADTLVVVHERPVVEPVALDADGVCLGDSTELNAQVSGGNASSYSFEWIPQASLSDAGVENPVAKPTASTTYEVVATDANGCVSDTGSVLVNVHQNPSVVAVADAASICEDASANLDATITNGSSDNITISWSGNGLSASDVEDPVVTPTLADTLLTYSVVVSDDNDCSSDTASVDIRVNPNPEDPFAVALDPSTEVCDGDSVTVSVQSPVSGMNYLWVLLPDDTLSSGPSTIEAKQTGDYVVIAQNDATECVSDASASVNITVNPNPDPFNVTVSPNDTICEGEFTTLSTSHANNPDAETNWYLVGGSGSPIGNSPDYAAGAEGVYTAVVSIEYAETSCSTEASDSVEIFVDPIPYVELTSNQNDALCVGKEVTLYVEVTGTSDAPNTYPDHEGYDFAWSAIGRSESYQDSITISSDTSFYSVTVTDTLTKCYNVDTVNLDVVYVFAEIFEDSMDVCLNSSEIFRFRDSSYSSSHGADHYSRIWKVNKEYTSYEYVYEDPDQFDTVDVSVRGESVGSEWYILEVEEIHHKCLATDSIFVKVNSLPTVKLTADKDTVCVGTEINLYATAEDGNPYQNTERSPYNYTWGEYSSEFMDPSSFVMMDVNIEDSSAIAYPTYSPKMIYAVSVTDSMGCIANDTLLVHPLPKQILRIPNLITPNNDGKNDVLYIEDEITRTDLFPGAKLEVYNRWGQAVYKTNDYQNDWSGKGVVDGIYYYHLEAGCGEDDEYKGWLHVISDQSNRPE